MFPKHSAFRNTREQQEYLEGVRERALNSAQKVPASTPDSAKQAASHLFETAAILIDEKRFEEAVELMNSAREILDADTV